MLLDLRIRFVDENSNNYIYQFGTSVKVNGKFHQISLDEEAIVELRAKIAELISRHVTSNIVLDDKT